MDIAAYNLIAPATISQVDLREFPQTKASHQAASNWLANRSALEIHQPELTQKLDSLIPALEWLFARDGYLTGRDAGGWWGGCSVPLLAGREMLKKLELAGSVGCFLNPTHAGQLHACYERIQPTQAIVVAIPDLLNLAVILRCDDFSREIHAGRLLFAAGWDWAAQLGQLFRQHIGLPTPQQFVRTAILDDTQLPKYSSEAEPVIAAETSWRTERISRLRSARDRRTISTGKILVVARSQFRLCDLAGPGLRTALLNQKPSDTDPFFHLDPDHPQFASPLAVASAASQADAIITADTFRADLPGVVADRVAWITWVTQGRISSPQPTSSADAILLADDRWLPAARSAGWPANRIALASWPTLCPISPTRPGRVGLLIETIPLEPPQRVKDYSSHAILWKQIEVELVTDPLAIGSDAGQYLLARMKRLKIPQEGFDAALFLERLILPAFHQGLAHLLARSGLPVAVGGQGWDLIPEFNDLTIDTPQRSADLSAAGLAALIHPWPNGIAHAFDLLDIPLIRTTGLTTDRFLSKVRDAVSGKLLSTRPKFPPLSRGKVASLVPGMNWSQEQPDSRASD